MATEKVTDEAIRQIQKLLNFKESLESLGATQENKVLLENAASKLQNLLMRFNLDLNQVKAASIAQKIRVSIEEVWIDTESKTKHSESTWIPKLYVGVARNNLCKVWYSSNQRNPFIVNIIGHSHNIALVDYICSQLIDKIRIAEKYAWKAYDKSENSWAKEKRGTWRRGFLEGAAYGIMTRLDRDYENMQNHDDNPYAVMIIDKKKEVDDWFYKEYPRMDPNWVDPNPEPEPSEEDIKKKRPRKIKIPKGRRGNSSNHGWEIGHEAGKSMEINKGVGTNQSKGHIN